MTSRVFELTILSLLAVAMVVTAASGLTELRDLRPENRSAETLRGQPSVDPDLAYCPFVDGGSVNVSCPVLDHIAPSTSDAICPFDPRTVETPAAAEATVAPLPVEAV